MKKFYELEVFNSKNSCICTTKTKSAIRCERMIHELETKDFTIVCSNYDKKIFILTRLRNIVKNLKLKKTKTEEVSNKKYYKLKKLLEYLEGTKVPYFKVPAFLRSNNCFLKILSPVVSTVLDGDKEKQFILEYTLTNTLWDRNQYYLEFTQIANFTATKLCYKQLIKEKELFKFLKKTRIKKQWDSFKSNPWALTLLGALIGVFSEKLINTILNIFNNQQEILIHIIK